MIVYLVRWDYCGLTIEQALPLDKFVEVMRPASAEIKIHSMAVLRITRSDGSILTVEQATQDNISESVRLFLKH